MALNNLSIENLTPAITSLPGVGTGGTASEARVIDEMAKQGLAGAAGGVKGGGNFADVLRNSIEQVNTFQNQADTAVKELVAGKNKNIHETMLAIERADTSLKLMMQVRNKVLDAYREIMRMQV
jgi:flagellar hook-basal body complex protein FliE